MIYAYNRIIYLRGVRFDCSRSAQTKVTYFGIFEPLASVGYSVYFPDLPGCVSYGENYERAMHEAKDALGLHLYGMEKDGEIIPQPSDHPLVDPETLSGFLVSPVTVFPDLVREELDTRSVKTNLTIPAWLKEMAEADGVNFSKVLKTALMDYLGLHSEEDRYNR